MYGIIMAAIWLLLAILSTSVAKQSTVYVVPSHLQRSDCPTDHCYNLIELADANNHFNSHMQLMFIPGDHIIDHNCNLIIQDINNLEISGKTNVFGRNTSGTELAKIACINAVAFGIFFRNVTNLTISNIAMSSCGAPPPFKTFSCEPFSIYNSEVNAEVYFNTFSVVDSSNVTFNGVTVANGRGIGAALCNVYTNLTITRSQFENNDINCYISIYEMNHTSAIILISKSSFMFGNLSGQTQGILASGLTMQTVAKNIPQIKSITIEILDVTMLDNFAKLGHFYQFFDIGVHQNLRIKMINFSAISRVLKGTYGIYLHTGTYGDTGSTYSFLNTTFEGTCLIFDNIGDIVLKNSVINDCNKSSIKLRGAIKMVIENMQVINSTGFMFNVISKYYAIHIKIGGICKFHGNQGPFLVKDNILGTGSLVFDENSTTQFAHNNILCIGDSRHSDCSTLFSNSDIILSRNASILFLNNTSAQSGGMTLGYTTLTLSDNSTIIFEGNTGSNGGAMEIRGGSFVSNYRNNIPTIRFNGNRAQQKGGAIYYTPPRHSWHNNCSVSFCEKHIPIVFYFMNNTALLAGSAMYVDAPPSEICPVQSPLQGCNPAYIHIEGESNDYSIVSSDPVRVCMCINSIPNCNITDYRPEIYPGQMYKIEVVAASLWNSTGVITVQAEYDKEEYSWRRNGGGQYLQHVEKTCTTVRYKTVIDSKQMRKLTLTPKSTDIYIKYYCKQKNYSESLPPQSKLLCQKLVIHFEIKNCSLGFTFLEDQKKCVCQQTFEQHNIECNLDTLSEVFRVAPKWINATFIHNVDTEPGVIIHDHCPFDYCRSDAQQIPLNLEHADRQCAFNRSGTLCGACQTNLSQVFGTSRCRHCSSLWVLLYLPAFILGGFMLVVFLSLLDLTTSIGTINGLIFYANIVRANQAIFFAPQATNSFLGWFIAWLNLDIGIETCFYDGLNAYIKTWLQFVFPFYIWIIVITIVVLSRHFTTVARLSGSNAVQVLATLFLLSYAKLIRIIITVFQSTTLLYPDGYIRRVWLYDGNMDYLKGKHIPLFIAALLLLVLLSLPYTSVLLTIQWLQKRNQFSVVLFWVRKLKPLFDAYTGPYKENHRYWTGLLLLIRVLLFLVFALNVTNDPSINLLAINTTTTVILTYLSLVGGVYESRLANIIEVSFLLNVGLLSAATSYQVNTSGNQAKIVYASTGVAFVSFIAIIMYHIIKRIAETRRGSKLKNIVESKFKGKVADRVNMIMTPSPVQAQVSHSSIELREPLLVT